MPPPSLGTWALFCARHRPAGSRQARPRPGPARRGARVPGLRALPAGRRWPAPPGGDRRGPGRRAAARVAERPRAAGRRRRDTRESVRPRRAAGRARAVVARPARPRRPARDPRPPGPRGRRALRAAARSTCGSCGRGRLRCATLSGSACRQGLPRGPARRTLAAGMAMDWDGARLTVLGPLRPAAPAAAHPQRGLGRARGGLRPRAPAAHGRRDGGGGARRCGSAAAAVLKVPHHGSAARARSQALLDAARPRLAIVSVGAHNPFGHPRAEVLERCRRAGALVLRTDRDGTIAVATDGRRLWVRTRCRARGAPIE